MAVPGLALSLQGARRGAAGGALREQTPSAGLQGSSGAGPWPSPAPGAGVPVPEHPQHGQWRGLGAVRPALSRAPQLPQAVSCVPWPGSALPQAASLARPPARTEVALLASAPSVPELPRAPRGPAHGGSAAVLGAGPAVGLAHSLSTWRVTISAPPRHCLPTATGPGTHPCRAQHPLPPAVPPGPRPASTKGSQPRPGVGQEAPLLRGTRLEMGVRTPTGAARQQGGPHGEAAPAAAAAAAPVCRGIARYAVCSSEDPYSRSQNSMKFNFTPI